MDIFEIAQQGMKIQEEEIKEKEAEEVAKKPFKLEIKEAVHAAYHKDYDWFNRLGENQKSFQPFMLNMWMGFVWTKNNARALSGNDPYYASLIRSINETMNTNVFTVPKEMFWLLACSTNEFINFDYDKKGKKYISSALEYHLNWVKKSYKSASEKYDKRVLDYMSQELYSSSDKIMEMIDGGLITEEDMKAIEQDLDTLEDQSKKKKK